MANPASTNLGGTLLVRWSPAIFWIATSSIILVLLDVIDRAGAETFDEAIGAVRSGSPAQTTALLAAAIAIALPALIALLRQRRLHFGRLALDSIGGKLASDVATVGAAGLTPKGSGTIGAVAALPAGWVFAQLEWPLRAAILAVLTALTTYASARYLVHAAKAAETKGAPAHLDPSEVVVDEYVGVLLAMAFVPWELPWIAGAFVLFRVFDIWKPGPVGWADRQLPGAWGVMFDDVIAGLMAGALLLGLASLLGI